MKQLWCHLLVALNFRNNYIGGTMSSGLHLLSMLYVKHAEWVKGEQHALTLLYEKSHQYIREKAMQNWLYSHLCSISVSHTNRKDSYLVLLSHEIKIINEALVELCDWLNPPTERKGKSRWGNTPLYHNELTVQTKHAFLVPENNMKYKLKFIQKLKNIKQFLMFITEWTRN